MTISKLFKNLKEDLCKSPRQDVKSFPRWEPLSSNPAQIPPDQFLTK